MDWSAYFALHRPPHPEAADERMREADRAHFKNERATLIFTLILMTVRVLLYYRDLVVPINNDFHHGQITREEYWNAILGAHAWAGFLLGGVIVMLVYFLWPNLLDNWLKRRQGRA